MIKNDWNKSSFHEVTADEALVTLIYKNKELKQIHFFIRITFIRTTRLKLVKK